MTVARSLGAFVVLPTLTMLLPSALAAQTAMPNATVQLLAQGQSTGGHSGDCGIGRGFECSFEAKTRRGADGAESMALEVVVIWRLPETHAEPRRARMADSAVVSAYREYARKADAEGRSFAGSMRGWYWTGMMKPGMSHMWDWQPGKPVPPGSLWVADSAFEVPKADSMLVILVDGAYTASGPAPRIHLVVRRPSEWRETGAKQWTNGDTTFMVRPRRELSPINDELLAIPEIRAFVERPRSP